MNSNTDTRLTSLLCVFLPVFSSRGAAQSISSSFLAIYLTCTHELGITYQGVNISFSFLINLSREATFFSVTPCLIHCKHSLVLCINWQPIAH